MIRIAAYRGKSFVSDSIRLLTYSVYSHIALEFSEDMEVDVGGKLHVIHAGNVIEAWSGGVRLVANLSEQHTPGTVVDLFCLKTPATEIQNQRLASFLLSQLGKRYDYWNVLRFVPLVRLVMPDPAPSVWTRNHVFCSELALEAFADAGIYLLERCKYWEIPPRDPPRSPLLYLQGSIVTK